MKTVYLCIGNGVRKDGSLGNINEEIVNSAMEDFLKVTEEEKKDTILIFSGGYGSKYGFTEANSMYEFACSKWFGVTDIASTGRIMLERKSYRTHNNAIQALQNIFFLPGTAERNTRIFLYDHPCHIERTKLSFDAVNRVYCRNIFSILVHPTKEVYDAQLIGQPYWASRKVWVPRERKMMLLYKFFLFRPWTRFGLWILKTVWPSEKQ